MSERRPRPNRRRGARSLRHLRSGWQQVEAEQAMLLRRLTTEESLRDLLSLQNAFEPQLRQTESLFRAERLAYLEDLQDKLNRLAEWTEGQSGGAV